jgi:hypothetical protein
MADAKNAPAMTFGQRLAAKMFASVGGGRVELHMSERDLANALQAAYEAGIEAIVGAVEHVVTEAKGARHG